MARETVKTYDDVLNSVRAFNTGLAQGKRLRQQISFFQSWYYVPELDAVGPSKFIRYKGMTAFEYIRGHAILEGRAVDPVLSKWFSRLESDSEEANWVRQKVEALVGRYGKIVSSGIRLNAPQGWNLNKQVKVSQPTDIVVGSSTSVMNPAVDSLWQRYLGLSQEAQKTLAERINNYIH